MLEHERGYTAIFFLFPKVPFYANGTFVIIANNSVALNSQLAKYTILLGIQCFLWGQMIMQRLPQSNIGTQKTFNLEIFGSDTKTQNSQKLSG